MAIQKPLGEVIWVELNFQLNLREKVNFLVLQKIITVTVATGGGTFLKPAGTVTNSRSGFKRIWLVFKIENPTGTIVCLKQIDFSRHKLYFLNVHL